MQLTDRAVVVSPSVVSAELEGEMVLLDVETGIYFGLDEVGSSIWKRLEQGCSEVEIHARLLEEYDVEPDLLRSDVARFLDCLRQQGLATAPAV